MDALHRKLFGTDKPKPLPGAEERAKAQQKWVEENQTDYSVFYEPARIYASTIVGAYVALQTGSPQAGAWAFWGTHGAIGALTGGSIGDPKFGIDFANPKCAY